MTKTSNIKTNEDSVCPISFHGVNKKVARLNAFSTFLIICIYLFTPFKFIVVLLAIDFFIRGYIDPKSSPISTINKNIINLLKIKSKVINAGPKIFAAKIGFLMAILISIIFYFLKLTILASFLAYLLIIFSLLEFLFGYCVGCHMYSLKHKLVHR
jgi:hypothetical protein